MENTGCLTGRGMTEELVWLLHPSGYMTTTVKGMNKGQKTKAVKWKQS